jgi:hypothetical protein
MMPEEATSEWLARCVLPHEGLSAEVCAVQSWSPCSLLDPNANAMEVPYYDEFKSWLTDFKAGYGQDAQTRLQCSPSSTC